MAENLRSTALRGIGTIGCGYFNECKAKAICGRVGTNFVAAEVPIPEDATNLLGAAADLRLAMQEWGEVEEPECTRKDNYLGGQPVNVYRVGNYSEEIVFKKC